MRISSNYYVYVSFLTSFCFIQYRYLDKAAQDIEHLKLNFRSLQLQEKKKFGKYF